MITTTYGLGALAIALSMLIVCWCFTISKTRWFRGYSDRPWRFAYMILLTTAISTDLVIGLIARSGNVVEHPWCCISIVPLLAAVLIRMTKIDDRRHREVSI